jgi:hypothetical protein
MPRKIIDLICVLDNVDVLKIFPLGLDGFPGRALPIFELPVHTRYGLVPVHGFGDA